MRRQSDTSQAAEKSVVESEAAKGDNSDMFCSFFLQPGGPLNFLPNNSNGKRSPGPSSALEVDVHNLEENPGGVLIGIRWAYGGATVGVSCAVFAIASNWITGGSGYDVGVSAGVVGLVVGLSCAFIGWASARNW
jgi:hypothetical protein